MKVEIRLDETCRTPRIIILTDRMTDEVTELAKQLSEEQPRMIAGFREDTVELLDPSDVYRFYAEAGKVYAETQKDTFTVRLRLYEIEQRFEHRSFVRISNSDILNLKKVKGFDLSFAGTICVTLLNGTVTYVSRRYVARIKQILGI